MCLFNPNHRFRRERPTAASGACQRCSIHSSFGRHAAIMEERGRQVGLQNGMASRRRYMESNRRVKRRAWKSLCERVAASLHQGDHVLVEGTLVSSTYQREYGKGKKATTVKRTLWQIRADSIRKPPPRRAFPSSGITSRGPRLASRPRSSFLCWKSNLARKRMKPQFGEKHGLYQEPGAIFRA